MSLFSNNNTNIYNFKFYPNYMASFKIFTYEQIQNDKDKYEEVFQYIKMYGVHAMAYSILQPKMNYFIIEGVGLVAYAKKGKLKAAPLAIKLASKLVAS